MTKKVKSGINIYSSFGCFVVRNQTGHANYRTTLLANFNLSNLVLQHLNINMTEKQRQIPPTSQQNC